MFELETALSNWKQSLLSDGSVVPGEALELEEHLRESLTNLRSAGLSQREAFIVAADRLGHPSELGQEYAKVNLEARWRRPVFWMLAGYIGMKVADSVVSIVISIATTTMVLAGAGGNATGIVVISLMALVWGSLAVSAYRHHESLGNFVERLPVKWVGISGTILIAASLLSFVWGGYIMRVVGPSWFAETSMYICVGQCIIQLLWLTFCLTTMWKFGMPEEQTHMESV